MARPSQYDAATQDCAVRMYFERLEEGGHLRGGRPPGDRRAARREGIHAAQLDLQTRAAGTGTRAWVLVLRSSRPPLTSSPRK